MLFFFTLEVGKLRYGILDDLHCLLQLFLCDDKRWS